MIKKEKIIKKSNKNLNTQNWKYNNKEYLRELQRFFDRVDNIEDYELRKSILTQMLLCDKVLTDIAENMFSEYYEKGYKKAKKG